MGRKRDPEVARRRTQALKLEQSGMTAQQVADAMNVNECTVRKWLRLARGKPKPPRFKAEVIRRLKQGVPFEQIVAEVGCTRENVRKIERQIRAQLTRTYVAARDPEALVDQFLADPEGVGRRRATRYPSFGRALIARCNHATNTDPKAAKRLIELAIGQFSLMRKTARQPEGLQLLTCNLVQARAIMAARERILAKDMAGKESALRLLESTRSSFPGCQACDADLSRRESIVLRDLKRYSEATEKLDFAESLYRGMGHSGHDYRQNGLGSCALVRMGIYYYTNRSLEAVRVAREAEKEVDTSENALLYKLRFNRALALLEINGRAAEARSLVEMLMGEVETSPTLARMLLVFLAGRAAEATGDYTAAVNYFNDTYQYAQELELAAAVGAMVADIARLSGTPTLLKDQVFRLFEHNSDGKPISLPSWLRPISKALKGAVHLSEKDFQGAIKLLRKESGGNRLLPLNAAMAVSDQPASSITGPRPD